MFVHYYTQVPLHIAAVERLVDTLRYHLGEWAGVAYREGEELRARVGPGLDGFAKEVRLQIGVAEVHRGGLAYPVEWTAIGAEGLFPRMSASLVLTHVGAEATNISFEGNYEPPLGPLGKVADRVLLRKVADATVKNWVDRLAAALTEAAAIN